jgi:hypothetical protein
VKGGDVNDAGYDSRHHLYRAGNLGNRDGVVDLCFAVGGAYVCD